MSQQNDKNNSQNNNAQCNCRSIEAWAETITSLYNFLVAQNNLAAVLDKSPLIHTTSPRPMLLQGPSNTTDNNAEYNIEDFPWFLNEMKGVQPTATAQNVKTTYFFTISPPPIPSLARPQENVYSEPISLPHNISFMDSLNMGDCNQIERTIENINLLEQSIMQNISQNYDNTVISYLQNMQQPLQMSNLCDSPNRSTVDIEDLDEIPSKLEHEPKSYLSGSSLESTNASISKVADVASDETVDESSQHILPDVYNTRTVGDLNGVTSDENEDETSHQTMPEKVEIGKNQLLPQEESNLSCYFQEYSDSDQSIDSQNLQSACESLYNVDSGDDDNSAYYDVYQGNKKSVLDSRVSGDDLKVDFVMNLVNDLLKDIEQFKGTCDIGKVSSKKEVQNCSNEESDNRDSVINSKGLSPKKIPKSSSKSEEIQTMDKKRFHGTLKAVIAKTAGMRKCINNENIAVEEELPETILKITNTVETIPSTSDMKKKTPKAKQIPKNLQELKEKLDALHRVKTSSQSANAAIRKTATNDKVLNKNSYAVTKKRSESPKPSASTKAKVTHSSRYANVESKVKKMLEANRNKTEGEGRMSDTCTVLPNVVKAKNSNSKEIAANRIDRTSNLKQQLDRLRFISKRPQSGLEKQVLSKPEKDARTSKDSLVKKASNSKPTSKAIKSRAIDSKASVTRPEVRTAKTTRLAKEMEINKKIEKVKRELCSSFSDKENIVPAKATPTIKKKPVLPKTQGHK